MSPSLVLAATALAPAIWGSTYLVTTEFLPPDRPLHVAALRALPAGLLLMLITHHLPPVAWLGRIAILGILNFSIFWALLFVSAYRLPGGVAATVGAIQPLIVLGLARVVIGSPVHPLSILAGIMGIAGVALLVLTPKATLDPLGVAAGLGAAVSMACGTVLSKRWQPPVSPLVFAAWQLTAGGLALVPFALLLEPALPTLTAMHIGGFLYLGLIGAALTYILWFNGIARLQPAHVAPLGFLSPVVAIALGWLVLGQQLSWPQGLGVATVFGSLALNHRVLLAQGNGKSRKGDHTELAYTGRRTK